MGWGDELMVTGQVRVMQQHDPRKVRIVYERDRDHEAWRHNPRIALPGERGDFQELRPRVNHLRPYMVAKERGRWTWKAWAPPAGELYFNDEESAFGERHAGRIILEPNLKWGASPNKQWGWVRWNKLAWLLQKAGHRITQVGPIGIPMLQGAEQIVTPGMRFAAAVMARARAAVLPEGGLHHVAAAVGTPAVVIFGGFISPAVTGYDSQVNLFTGGGLGCGMRAPCEHCKDAMAAITPEAVADRLMELICAQGNSVTG